MQQLRYTARREGDASITIKHGLSTEHIRREQNGGASGWRPSYCWVNHHLNVKPRVEVREVVDAFGACSHLRINRDGIEREAVDQ